MTRDEIVKGLRGIKIDCDADMLTLTRAMYDPLVTAIKILKACPVDKDGNVVMTDGVVGYGAGSGPREVGS